MPDLRIFYTVYFITRRREVRYRRSWKNLACNKSQSLKELCRLLRPGTLIAGVLDLARLPLVLRSFVGCNFKKSYSQSLLLRSVTVREFKVGFVTRSFQIGLRPIAIVPVLQSTHSSVTSSRSNLRTAQPRQLHHITTTSIICPLFHRALVGRAGART